MRDFCVTSQIKAARLAQNPSLVATAHVARGQTHKSLRIEATMMRSLLRFLWPFCGIIWHYLVLVSCENSIIPLINLENESEMELAHEIRRACQETGFFAISNHGVNATTIQQAWDASRAFFDLDLQEKQKSTSYNTTEYPYGYEQEESLTRGKARDDKTVLQVVTSKKNHPTQI